MIIPTHLPDPDVHNWENYGCEWSHLSLRELVHRIMFERNRAEMLEDRLDSLGASIADIYGTALGIVGKKTDWDEYWSSLDPTARHQYQDFDDEAWRRAMECQ